MHPTFKKFLYFPLTKIIISIAVCFAALVVVQNFITKPVFRYLIATKEIADTIINYISVFVLLFTYFVLFRTYEKRTISELSLKHLPKEFSGGLLAGFASLSLVILSLYLLGYYSATGISTYSSLLAPLSFLAVAALLEEIMFRLIIYRILEDWKGTWFALIFSSILFTIQHLSNNDVHARTVLFIFLFSVVHGLMYNLTKRLWLPFSFHLGWNFSQPFYGSNLSGIKDIDQVIDGKFNGPALLTGSGFGIEDSILSIILLMILSTIFLYYAKKLPGRR